MCYINAHCEPPSQCNQSKLDGQLSNYQDFFSLFFRWVVSQKSLPFFLYLLFENANSSDSARMFMQGIDEHYECVSFGQINSTDLLSFRLIVRL